MFFQVRKRKEGVTEISATLRAKLEGEGILRRQEVEEEEQEGEERKEGKDGGGGRRNWGVEGGGSG